MIDRLVFPYTGLTHIENRLMAGVPRPADPDHQIQGETPHREFKTPDLHALRGYAPFSRWPLLVRPAKHPRSFFCWYNCSTSGENRPKRLFSYQALVVIVFVDEVESGNCLQSKAPHFTRSVLSDFL